jgi:hypothetical protein
MGRITCIGVILWLISQLADHVILKNDDSISWVLKVVSKLLVLLLNQIFFYEKSANVKLGCISWYYIEENLSEAEDHHVTVYVQRLLDSNSNLFTDWLVDDGLNFLLPRQVEVLGYQISWTYKENNFVDVE